MGITLLKEKKVFQKYLKKLLNISSKDQNKKWTHLGARKAEI